MNEIFDQLIIQVFFTVFICGILYLYKYIHAFFYRNERNNILKVHFPSENSSNTLHFFSRLIGVSLVLSTLSFDQSNGLFLSMFHFFVWGSLGCLLYIVSIYMMESIVFYNFEYFDEVQKRRNMSYAVISFTQTVSLAFIVRAVVQESEGSLIILLMLWLFAMVLFGFATKLYPYVSKFTVNKFLIRKNMSLAISYSGFILGCTIIILNSFDQEHFDIKSYGIQVFLRVLLSLIFYPLFRKGVLLIFKLHEEKSIQADAKTDFDVPLGYGVYEGATYLTTALLTSIIVARIQFGTIYPFF
jgi:uncharacterized membrane protein YjfL (UPF0719 family)